MVRSRVTRHFILPAVPEGKHFWMPGLIGVPGSVSQDCSQHKQTVPFGHQEHQQL